MQATAVQQRLAALFDVYRLDPTSPDAYPILALSLASTYIPGLKIQLSKVSPKPKRNRGGRPKFPIEPKSLIEEIETFVDAGDKVSMACKRIAWRLHPQKRLHAEKYAKQLANQYYKHAKEVRARPEYIADHADRLCARRSSAPCCQSARNFDP
jgi:hypothetical protein